MTEKLKTWLEIEIADTTLNYKKAWLLERESGYDPDLTMDRKYQEGYLDALEQVKREINK